MPSEAAKPTVEQHAQAKAPSDIYAELRAHGDSLQRIESTLQTIANELAEARKREDDRASQFEVLHGAVEHVRKIVLAVESRFNNLEYTRGSNGVLVSSEEARAAPTDRPPPPDFEGQ